MQKARPRATGERALKGAVSRPARSADSNALHFTQAYLEALNALSEAIDRCGADLNGEDVRALLNAAGGVLREFGQALAKGESSAQALERARETLDEALVECWRRAGEPSELLETVDVAVSYFGDAVRWARRSASLREARIA